MDKGPEEVYRSRSPRLLAAVVCSAALFGAFAAPHAAAVVTRQSGDMVTVEAADYTVEVDLAHGARITSFRRNGVDLTALGPQGRGGLLSEVHSVAAAFELRTVKESPGQTTMVAAGAAGDLHIVRRYTFYDDRPWVAAEIRFENRSCFPLSGVDAPRLRNLALPAGAASAGREFYCLNRGRGAEAMSEGLLPVRLARFESTQLGWMAVADPVSRRVLGMAVATPGCRPLPPERTHKNVLLTGWQYPTIPAGQALTSRMLLVPLEGMDGLADLNEHFAADSVPDATGEPQELRLTLVPLRETGSLSVITRTYAADGRELEPCDPLLLDRLEPMQPVQGRVVCTEQSETPAWFLHEVYGSGELLGRFAVPVAEPQGPAAGARPPGQPSYEEVADAPNCGPAPQEPTEDGIPLVVWRFDGTPGGAPAQRLEFWLPAGQQRTRFLGLRASRPVDNLKISIAPDGRSQAAPASAFYLWRVDDSALPARLRPLEEFSLRAGETAWVAVTADASWVEAGSYGASLQFTTSGATMTAPLTLRIVRTPPEPDDFGLWHVTPAAEDAPTGSVLSQLKTFGVDVLTLEAADSCLDLAGQTALGEGSLGWLRGLSFTRGQGTLAPAGPTPGGVALPRPRPTWLVDGRTVGSSAVQAALQAGYAPAVICGAIATAAPEFAAGPQAPVRRQWLVAGGCVPDAVPELLEEGVLLPGDEVWTFLDLRGKDWRRAAREVPSVFWAAAWQGVAGAAVRCAPPSERVEQPPVIWHIVRDARHDVALWRALHRTAARALAIAQGPLARREGMLTLQKVEAMVGPAANYALPVRTRMVRHRRLYRVGARDDQTQVTVADFERARQRLIELADLVPPMPPEPGEPQWDGLPAEGGRWAIYVPSGDQGWNMAQDFQLALEERWRLSVPVLRSWDDVEAAAPQLVWAFVDVSSESGLPRPLQAALHRRPLAPLVLSPPGATPAVAMVRPLADLHALLRTIGAGGGYPTADRVR